MRQPRFGLLVELLGMLIELQRAFKSHHKGSATVKTPLRTHSKQWCAPCEFQAIIHCPYETRGRRQELWSDTVITLSPSFLPKLLSRRVPGVGHVNSGQLDKDGGTEVTEPRKLKVTAVPKG